MDKFKKLWGNKRYKAMIQLGMWFVFFLIIVLLCSMSSENVPPVKIDEKTEQKDMFSTLEDMQNKLLNSKTNYIYKINSIVDNTTTIFDGEINEGVDTGYFESVSEIYKYSCTLEKCYKVFIDHQEEFPIEDYALLFIKNNFDLIKDVDLIEKVEDDLKIYSYSFNVQEENWELKIKTNKTNILTMMLTTQKLIYEINFEY